MKFGRYLTFLTLLVWFGVAAGETADLDEASESFGESTAVTNVTIPSATKNISRKSHLKKTSAFQPVIKAYIPNSRRHARNSRKILVAHVPRYEEFHPQVKPFIPQEKKHAGTMQFADHSKLTNFHPRIKLFVPDQRKYAQKGRKAKIHHLAASHHAVTFHAPVNNKFTKHAMNKHSAKLHAQVKQEINKNNQMADQSLPEQTIPIKYADIITKSSHLQVALKNIAIPENTHPAEKSEVTASQNKVHPILDKKIMADANLGGKTVGVKIQEAKPALKVITSAAVGVNPAKIKTQTAVGAIFISQTKKPAVKAVGMPVPVILSRQDVKPSAKSVAAATPAAKKDKIINSDETDRQPAVKFIAGDLSKDEFYILGEDDPVPEKLATNPETQIAILGGDMNEAAKKIMEFKLAAITAARERAQRELTAKEESARVLADLEFEEREAKAKLAAAQKAMDDVKKLKKWRQENDTPIGEIVENVGSAYKDTIVSSVVPEKIKTKEQTVAGNKGLIPIEHIAISNEMILPDGEFEVAASEQVVKENVTVEKTQPMKIEGKPLIHLNRSVAQKNKKAKPTNIKQLSEEQINDAVIGIKSAYDKKKVKAVVHGRKTVVETEDHAAPAVNVQKVSQHVIDYEADRDARISIDDSQHVEVTSVKTSSPVAASITKPVIDTVVKPNLASKPVASKMSLKPQARQAAPKPTKVMTQAVEKKKIANPVVDNAVKAEIAKSAVVATPNIVKPVAVKAVEAKIAKPAVISPAKPTKAKINRPEKEETVTFNEHDMSKIMNDLEKSVWQQKKLKMKTAKTDKAKKPVVTAESSPDNLDDLSISMDE